MEKRFDTHGIFAYSSNGDGFLEHDFLSGEERELALEDFPSWFYRMDMPEGYKHFSKTKPMRLEHCSRYRRFWV